MDLVFTLREKNRAALLSKFGFIPKGPIGKTVGLSYKPEAQ